MDSTRLVLGFLLIIQTFLISCSGEDMGFDMSLIQDSNIQVLQGEPTLNERLDLNIQLPIEEERFIELLELKNIQVKRESYLSKPYQKKNFDMTDISHGLDIYIGYNKDKCRNERYYALVDNDNFVVYIESRFGYLDPLGGVVCD